MCVPVLKDAWCTFQLRAQNGSVRLRFDAISIYVGSAVLIDNVELEPGECDQSCKANPHTL